MWSSESTRADAEATLARWREDGFEGEVAALYDKAALDAAAAAAVAAERELWEDATRSLLAIALLWRPKNTSVIEDHILRATAAMLDGGPNHDRTA